MFYKQVSECKINEWPKDVIGMSIQIAFVFTFLTMFFFLYVQQVEKMEFISQMNLIVDTLMKDVEDNITPIKNNDDFLVVLNGVIDVLEKNIIKDSKSSVKNVEELNIGVKTTAYKSLISFILVIVVIATCVLLLGFCIPLQYQLKKAIIIVIAVGITELVFLQIIAKNYISADPNKVKRELSDAIRKWIKTNKKI
jgi:hypothetical protein